MREHIWGTVLAVGLAFFAAGVFGMIDEPITHASHFWLFFSSAIFGFTVALISIFHNRIINFSKQVKAECLFILRVITRVKEAGKFLAINDEQQRSPEKWLYPVVQYIDLNRQGLSKNEAVVRFDIDSALFYPIDEYYVSIKLCLKDTTTFQEKESANWHEIKPYPPIRPLERHHFCESIVCFGEGKDNTLLEEMMERFRNGYPILAMLKIGVNFKKEDKPIFLEGSRWIMPINNYRGD